MRLLASPATGLLEWVRDYASQNAVALVGDIAAAAVQVSAEMQVCVVDDLFRTDPRLQSLIVLGPEGPVLLERSWFESIITGRLGYGRLLHARRPILALATHESLVLAHDCTIEAAAAAVISRRATGHAATATIVAWPDGVLKVALISTVFERLAHQYAYQSWHDPLTKLPNRRYLREQLKVLERDRTAAAEAWQVVLFRLDVDRFKAINDTFGHGVGDQVLTQIAARIRAASRRDDLVVRLGGDEFAVLTAVPFTLAERESFAARLVVQAAVPMRVEIPDGPGGLTGRLVTVSASVGVAHSRGDDDDGSLRGSLTGALDVLLRNADLAVRQAKDEGRGRARHFAVGRE